MNSSQAPLQPSIPLRYEKSDGWGGQARSYNVREMWSSPLYAGGLEVNADLVSCIIFSN